MLYLRAVWSKFIYILLCIFLNKILFKLTDRGFRTMLFLWWDKDNPRTSYIQFMNRFRSFLNHELDSVFNQILTPLSISLTWLEINWFSTNASRTSLDNSNDCSRTSLKSWSALVRQELKKASDSSMSK